MDNTTSHPATQAYLSTLSLLLAPHPHLSASAAHSLSSQKPLAPAALDTKCSACRSELVGGLNAAFWVEAGSLWARCESCGWASKRGGAEGVEMVQSGKARFDRVKKRRKVASELVPKISADTKGFRPIPTPLLSPAPTASASPKPLPTTSRTASLLPSSSPRPSPAPAAPSSVAPPTKARSALPSRFASPSSSLPSNRPSPSPAPSAPSSTSNSTRASPSPALNSGSDSSATAKKRKRAKQQPSGLAELLEAKRKEKATASAGGGVGLMDFLQGI